MPDDPNKKPDEEPLVPVGPAADEFGDETVVTDEGDQTRSAAGGDDDDDDDDSRVGHAAGGSDDDDDGREGVRQRRRQEKQRKKVKRQRAQRELNFLRIRNEQLERRFSELDGRTSQAEMVGIDQRISSLEENIRLADQVHAEAIDNNKGKDASEALAIRGQLQEQLQQIKGVKQNLLRREQFRRDAPQVDPTIQQNAQAWIADHEWFDPNIGDEDSAIAKAVEDRLAASRQFDPRTTDYWEELDRRLAKRLPHLYEDGADDDDDGGQHQNASQRQNQQTSRKRGGPRLTSGGRERPLGKNEVYVSKERVEAMKAAGVWDDPELRARYLKRYQEYDREHGINRRLN